MGIQLPLEMATDAQFREAAGYTTPPRAGVVTALEPSGQVRVALDDPDGGEGLAWPLNGFVYGVGDVVYVVFAANSPDGGVVLGAKAPLPTFRLFNGTGGLIFVTKTGIDGTTQTILPAGTGAVRCGLAGHVVVTDGVVGATTAVWLAPGGVQDVAAGTLTVRLTCAADGSVTVKRQSGTGTATVALLAVWL